MKYLYHDNQCLADEYHALTEEQNDLLGSLTYKWASEKYSDKYIGEHGNELQREFLAEAFRGDIFGVRVKSLPMPYDIESKKREALEAMKSKHNCKDDAEAAAWNIFEKTLGVMNKASKVNDKMQSTIDAFSVGIGIHIPIPTPSYDEEEGQPIEDDEEVFDDCAAEGEESDDAPEERKREYIPYEEQARQLLALNNNEVCIPAIEGAVRRQVTPVRGYTRYKGCVFCDGPLALFAMEKTVGRMPSKYYAVCTLCGVKQGFCEDEGYGLVLTDNGGEQ